MEMKKYLLMEWKGSHVSYSTACVTAQIRVKAAEVFCVSNSWEEDGREYTGVEERTVGGNE